MVGEWQTALTICFFFLVFTIGIVGNVWVVFSVCRILYRSWSPINSVFQHMSMYILSLSVVDFFVLCMAPMPMGYFLQGSWQFGYIACKLFWAVENINKLLSVALLAVMSFERFLAVCRPLKLFCCRRKRVCNVFAVISILITLIILLCFPIIYYADVIEMEFSADEYSDEMGDGTIMITTVCRSNLPETFLPYFIIYMFLFGFVIPAIIIALCYIFLIRHLRHKDGKNTFVTSYTSKVVRSILRVVVFHFVCWTPFWFFVILPLLPYFFEEENWSVLFSPWMDTMRMCASFLPYLNCAGNWIFYAAMNRELRETVTFIGRRPRQIGSFHLRSIKTLTNSSLKTDGPLLKMPTKIIVTSPDTEEDGDENL